MKKIEEIIKEKSDYRKDASSLKKSISFSMYEKKKTVVPFKKWGWSLLAIFLIGIVSVTALIKGDSPSTSSGNTSSSNNSGNNTPDHNTPSIPQEKYETLAFKNKRDIVDRYEKNASFIDSGFEMVKIDEALQVSETLNDTFEVNATEFKEGEVGKYNITIASNSNKHLKMQYEVQVVDETIQSIEIDQNKTRKVYYLGEPVLKEDVYLNKICVDANGKTLEPKEVKRMEFEVDTSNYDANHVGTYKIGISLINATDVRSVEYEIEVKPLEEINLDGDYYFYDDECLSGEVNVYVASIEEGKLIPHFAEFYDGTSDQLTYSFIDGRLILRGSNKSQYLEYFPKERILKLSGMIGEEWILYAKNDYDKAFSIRGENVSEDEYYQFIVKDGYMDAMTLSYLQYTYGGVYFAESFKDDVKVEEDAEIQENSILYVGFTPYEEKEEEPYFGIWYFNKNYFRMPYLVAFSFENGKLINSNGLEVEDYRIQETSQGYLLWISHNEKYLYIGEYDTFITDEAMTNRNQLARYDASKQCLVTLSTGRSAQRVVVEKGKPLITGFAREGSYTQLEINSYKGTPIEKDTTFSVRHISRYLFEIEGNTFGTYDDYYKIVSNNIIHADTQHQYLLIHYDHFQEVIVGWIAFLDIDTLEVLSLDDARSILTFDFSAEKLVIEEKEYEINNALYANLDFVGVYKSAEGKTITLTEKGRFDYTIYIDRGGVVKPYSDSLNYRLISFDENKISIELNHVFEDNEIIKLTYEEGVWKFTWNSQEYTLLKENSQ